MLTWKIVVQTIDKTETSETLTIFHVCTIKNKIKNSFLKTKTKPDTYQKKKKNPISKRLGLFSYFKASSLISLKPYALTTDTVCFFLRNFYHKTPTSLLD